MDLGPRRQYEAGSLVAVVGGPRRSFMEKVSPIICCAGSTTAELLEWRKKFWEIELQL